MKSTRILGTVASALAMLAWGAALDGQAKPAAAASAGATELAQHVTDRLKEELTLTADQIPKVQAINLSGANALEALLKKYAADTSAASDKALVRGLLSAVQAYHGELKKVFTPAQWALHQQHRAQRMALNQTELMAYTLDLSRSQILDVERINMESMNRLVRTLEQPAGAPKRTRQQMIAVARPVIEQRDSVLKNVLTVEQWKVMQENRRALRDLLMEQAGQTIAAAPPPAKPKS